MVFFAFLVTLGFTDRFVAPPELDKFCTREFNFVLDDERYDKNESRWKEACCSGFKISRATKEMLWDELISVQIGSGVQANANIDKVGLSVESSLVARKSTNWQDVRKDLERVANGKSVEKAILELHSYVVALRETMRDEKKAITFFATVRSVKIADTSQNWLLIEAVSDDPNWPIFPRNVLHKLLMRNGKRALELIQPHPELLRIRDMVDADRKKERKPNRFPEQVFGSLPPITPDGLTNTEREWLYNYEIVEEQILSNYQFEIVGERYGSGPASPVLAGDVVVKRIPPGKVLTYDELHRICGEECKTMREMGFQRHIRFSIVPYQHGKFTYSALYAEYISSDNPSTNKD